MNRQIVKLYIEDYKKNFSQVHDHEIYKWRAIKQFQDNFNINSGDFLSNLNISLSKAANLLDSGQYFPKRMLFENTERNPEQIRDMFKILYDEDLSILERIVNFRADFKILNKYNFGNKSDYQDHRAIIVYLTLFYPERYFLYKYTMFKDFAEKVEYTYLPVKGKIENIGQYQNLCELVRYEIEKDQEILMLHEDRLDNECYRDKGHNVLTQDFMYAVVKYLNKTGSVPIIKTEATEIFEVQSSELIVKNEQTNFTPQTINYIQNNIENKRLGDLGEIWVLTQEIEYLKKRGKQKLANQVKHVSKDQGDGLGFDILSFDIYGNKKYIEVKTTKGNCNSTFFVTKNELERSKVEKDNYFLYRVYDFDENYDRTKLLKIQGELTRICKTPINFKVTLKYIEETSG